MIYLIMPIFLLIFFELSGQLILKKMNYPIFRYNSPIGFIVFLGLLYVIMPVFLYFRFPTYTLWIICSLQMLIFTVFIIVNYKSIELYFDYTIILVAFFMAAALYKFYNSGLGGRGFDTSYYLIWIASIIEYPNLNEYSIQYGTVALNQSVNIGDIFLTYYQFAAYLVWICKQFFTNLLNYTYDYMPAYMWTMSVLYFHFFITTIINFIEKLKINNKFIIILIYIFVGYYIGNLYWHNTYAFYGNTYRFVIIGYVIFFLYEIINNKDNSNYVLLLMSTLALSSTGTSSAYFIIPIGYAYIFTNYKNDNQVIRHSSLLLFLPLTFLVLATESDKFYVATIMTIILLIIAIILNDKIYRIFYKFKIFNILTYLIPIFLIIVAQYTFGFTENYDKFFNHISGVGDMTWEFFKFKNWRYYAVNFFVYTLFINFIIKKRKEPLTKFLLIVVLTFLNPLSGALIAYRIKTYLRALDIILNPFTYIIFINSLYETLKINKYIYSIIFTILIMIFAVIGNNYYTTYYNQSMAPTENFNHIYKIDNSELEPIIYIDGIIRDNDLQDIKIIAHTEYFRAFQPQTFNIYNRYYTYIRAGKDQELYEIFYPSRDYSERKDDNLYDYDNAYHLLLENGYDFVICDKQYDLYDVKGEWYYPRYQILDYYMDPIYENDDYIVFWTYLDK